MNEFEEFQNEKLRSLFEPFNVGREVPHTDGRKSVRRQDFMNACVELAAKFNQRIPVGYKVGITRGNQTLNEEFATISVVRGEILVVQEFSLRWKDEQIEWSPVL